MFTANSMNCLAEALGMALPGNGTILATSADRKALYERASQRIVAMATRVRPGSAPGHGLLPREIATAAAFDNAMILDMAMGGSTNTVLHILAIAHEAERAVHDGADRRAEPEDAQHLQGRARRASTTSRTSPAPGASTRSSARSPAAARACST